MRSTFHTRLPFWHRSCDQFLNRDNCEVLTSEEEAAEYAPVRLWDDAEVQQYIASGLHPASPGPDKMDSASSIVVLGSHVSYDVAQSAAVSHRVACAWSRWQGIRPQLRQSGVPLRLRCSLLQTVVAAALLWGLESVNANREVRRRLTGVHRKMLSACILVLRRRSETEADFFRRRERIVSAMLKRHFRCYWGQLQ